MENYRPYVHMERYIHMLLSAPVLKPGLYGAAAGDLTALFQTPL